MLLAYCLRGYKENVIIYFNNNEVELSEDILDAINDVDGEKYQLLVDIGAKEKIDTIDSLLNLFSAYTNSQSRSINKVYNVVKCMQTWIIC